MNRFYKPDSSGTSHSTIARICRWFKKAKPQPSYNDVSTQLGVHFEEVAEMVGTLTASTARGADLLNETEHLLIALSDHLKATNADISVRARDRTEFLDALCDQIVTATGCGVLLHMDVTGAIDNVSDSNDSKFDSSTGQPILDENGKIMKGPAYVPPSLGAFV